MHSISADMSFSDAAKLYLELRLASGPRRYIKPATEHSYRQYIESLKLFFGEMLLRDIDWLQMQEYQQARVAGAEPFIRFRRPHDAKPRKVNGTIAPAKGKTSCPVKPEKVNQELRLLKALKKRADCWTAKDDDYYEELLEPESEMPRALTREQERRWLEISGSRTRWMIVHWYSLLCLHTCMGTNEIRALRLGDLNLQIGVLTIPPEGAKNRHRMRTIQLDHPDALWAAEQILGRAKALGSVNPQDYLFPFRDIRANGYVPTRPMTVHGIRALWIEVREAADLRWFRPYDLRHTAITRLAEAGTSMAVIMEMAGHISPRMSRHYTHVADQIKLKAMRAAHPHLFSKRAEPIRAEIAPEPRQAPRAEPERSIPLEAAPAALRPGFYVNSWTW